MMIRQHPAPGVDQLPPGVQGIGRAPRPGMGMLVNAYFPLPQNPVKPQNALNKSLLQVGGVPTAIGPSNTELHGMGFRGMGCGNCDGNCGGCGMNGLSDTFGSLGQYAVYGVIGLLLYGMFTGKKGRGGSRPAPQPASVTV